MRDAADLQASKGDHVAITITFMKGFVAIAASAPKRVVA
jgi:hypothetical protein